MEILILNWKDIKHPERGGAEVIAYELAKRLVKDGHKVIFFCQSFPGCKKEEIIDGITTIRRGNKLTVFFQAYLFYRKLTKKPDKVIEMINSICWQTPLYIPRSRVFAYVNQFAKEVWFYEFPLFLAILGYLFELIEYTSYKDRKFLCYSNSTKEDLIKIGIPERNVFQFPIGIDIKRYTTAKEKARTPLFIFVARLVSMKRGDLCIQAMKRVLQYVPHAKLAIIGNGPQEEALTHLVNKLDLTRAVEFINKNNFFIKDSKIDMKIVYMQQAWALLLPSVKEGWGMVIIEAAACGTPAIVSNVTGLKDSVLDKKTGFILSKTPTVAELANAMIYICKQSELRKKLSHNATLWAKNFTWEKSYKRFKELLFNS